MKFVETIKKEEKLLNDYPCFFAKTFKDASQLLKQPKHNIRVVFLSSAIGTTLGVDELKKIKTDRPLIPVFLISGHNENEMKELIDSNCGFLKIIPKPANYSDITKEMADLFASKERWTGIEVSQEEKFIELSLQDDGYIPTSLTDFVLTPHSFFNIFIKLGPSKFVKVLNAGDLLHRELLDSYTQKGVTHLFIAEDEHKKYIRFCDELSAKIVKRQDVASSKKITNVLNLGSTIAHNLIYSGISPEKLDFANSFLNQCVGLIKSMKLKNESLKQFIDSIGKKEHCATVSFLAGIIANEVGIESIKSVKLDCSTFA